jgi:hypothetical protein
MACQRSGWFARGGAQKGLELGEGHFDGIEVGTVWRQASQARAGGLDASLTPWTILGSCDRWPGMAVSCVISTSVLIGVGRPRVLAFSCRDEKHDEHSRIYRRTIRRLLWLLAWVCVPKWIFSYTAVHDKCDLWKPSGRAGKKYAANLPADCQM